MAAMEPNWPSVGLLMTKNVEIDIICCRIQYFYQRKGTQSMAKMLSLITTIPFGLLMIACIAYWQTPITHPTATGIYPFSYAVYAAGMLLSWWFNRSRIFFMLLVIALAQFTLSELAATMIGAVVYTRNIYPIIALLLPINIGVFFLLKERGIFNGWGLTRFGFILLQSVYIAVAVITNDDLLLHLFQKEVLGQTLPMPTPLPQPSVLAYCGLAVFLLLQQMRQQTYLGSACGAALTATLIGLHIKAEPVVIPAFFSVAGIILIIAVIQDSYSMAYLDELTGLPARRALKEDLLKLSGDYTIAMVDIDFFKKFNDTYGHDTGDDVLRLVASVLKTVTGGGKAFRYGGEEFTILFPKTNVAEALPHLDHLRASIEKCPYAYKKKSENRTKKQAAKQLFVTISIGVAERSEKYRQPNEVIKAADKALYRAKKKGRNCVSK